MYYGYKLPSEVILNYDLTSLKNLFLYFIKNLKLM